MAPVSYGIWERCEYTNVTLLKQGVTIGTRKNVKFCYPNLYMRYSPKDYNTCYNIRRQCPVLDKDQISKGCSCRYLPSAKGLQWLTVLAAICLILGLILLYLKVITSPENSLYFIFNLLIILFEFVCLDSALVVLVLY
jgi:hypothetical protein